MVVNLFQTMITIVLTLFYMCNWPAIINWFNLDKLIFVGDLNSLYCLLTWNCYFYLYAKMQTYLLENEYFLSTGTV